jgi:acetyl-CoA synthetase
MPDETRVTNETTETLSQEQRLGEQGATAAAKTSADVSEAQIAVHWREEEYYHPTAKFIGQANLTDPSVNERFSTDKFPECFKEYADMLS